MSTLKQLLWERWGNAQYPAEWDGRDGGGGKGSQRFWEYLWAVHQLGDGLKSVLDVGAGSHAFFANLLRAANIHAEAVDPELEATELWMHKTRLEDFSEFGRFNWTTCISVLEHIDDKVAFCRALDRCGGPIVLTFEYGEECVDNKSLTQCLAAFQRHHITRMEACPVYAENSSPLKWRPVGLVLALNQ